jgi:hypothetical protein
LTTFSLITFLAACMEMPDEYTAARDREMIALRKKDFPEARKYAQLALEAAAHAEGDRGCYEQIEARNALGLIESMNTETSSCLLRAQEGVQIYDAFTGQKGLRIHLVGTGALNNAGNASTTLADLPKRLTTC